ncbi:hypothetical protein A6F58_16460 [Prescottella equi]|nr:hypothetical protein [Prescottella equi]NKS19462.1 hypothetical protein [Prescottella equi]ORJ94088.1 hypothetical protein A6F58_16460 [Prescottella equi]
MWRNTMPRGLRLSLAAVGALVLVGAPTATAAPSDGANEVTTTAAPTTTTAAAATTTAAPTTTRERYVSRGDSEEATATTTTTTTTTPATAVAPTTSAPAPTTPVGNRALTAAAGRAGLSITVAGQWATVVPGAQSANGTLTLISVSDNALGSDKSWVATASSTDFVGPYGTIPKSAVTYEPTAVAGKTLGGTLSVQGPQSLGTPQTVVERTGLDWLETITWTPRLRVNYPDGAAVGSYTGTITISVA